VSGFAEISEALRATCGEVPALRSRVERVRASAHSLADQADSHGWSGVAGSMRGAADALETSLVELAEFKRAGEAAVAQLVLIDDQGSIGQVSEHLAGAEEEITVAVRSIDAVTGLVDVALQACAQAGQRGLPTALSALREDVIKTHDRLEQSRSACDAERQSVEAWLQENPGQGTASSVPGEEAESDPSGAEAAARSPANTAPEAQAPPVSSVVVRDTFDQLLDPTDRTLLPRGTGSLDSFRLRPVQDRDDLRANSGDTAPEAGLTRRTRRLVALIAAGTLVGQATIGAVLEFGSPLGQAIGTAVFGVIALVIEGPEIAKTIPETRRKRSTRPGVRKRAHGE
jgi:hypothetical protein